IGPGASKSATGNTAWGRMIAFVVPEKSQEAQQRLQVHHARLIERKTEDPGEGRGERGGRQALIDQRVPSNVPTAAEIGDFEYPSPKGRTELRRSLSMRLTLRFAVLALLLSACADPSARPRPTPSPDQAEPTQARPVRAQPRPVITVEAVYPGANAQVVSDTLAETIEQQVRGVEK